MNDYYDYNSIDDEERKRREATEGVNRFEAGLPPPDKEKPGFLSQLGDVLVGRVTKPFNDINQLAQGNADPFLNRLTGGGQAPAIPQMQPAQAPAQIQRTDDGQSFAEQNQPQPPVLDSNGRVVTPQTNPNMIIPQGPAIPAGPQAQAFPVSMGQNNQTEMSQPQPVNPAAQQPNMLQRLNPIGTAQAGTLPNNVQSQFVERMPMSGTGEFVAADQGAPGAQERVIQTGAPQTQSDVAGITQLGVMAQTNPFVAAGYDDRVMSILSNPQASEDELGQLRYDPTVSADIRENIRERMEPLLRARLEIPKANAVIDNSTKDPKAARQVYKETAEDKPEGSWIKAILLARLGMTELAQEEFIKLGLGDSNRNAIVDGQPVSIRLDGKGRVKSGRFIGVDATEGRKSGNLTGEQLTQAMLQVNDPRVKVGSTKYEAVVGGERQFFKELIVGSQTYWQNESTGALTKSPPGNLKAFGKDDPLERQAGEAATAAIKTFMERNPHASPQEIDRVSNLAFSSVMRAGGRDSRNQQGGALATGGGGSTGSSVTGQGQSGTYGRGDGSAASVNNPSGLGARKDANGQYVWRSYSTPQEGVADTQNLVANYLANPGRNTPESLVGTWVTGDPRHGAQVQNGAYLASVNKNLADAGVRLNADGTIPNTPEANNAITRAIIVHESGADKAQAFLPYVGGKVEPTQVASAVTSDANPPAVRTETPTTVDRYPLPKRIGAPTPTLSRGEQQDIDDIASGRAPIPTDKENLWKATEARRQYGPISPMTYKGAETFQQETIKRSVEDNTKFGQESRDLSNKSYNQDPTLREIEKYTQSHPHLFGVVSSSGILDQLRSLSGDQLKQKIDDAARTYAKTPEDRNAVARILQLYKKAEVGTINASGFSASMLNSIPESQRVAETIGSIKDSAAAARAAVISQLAVSEYNQQKNTAWIAAQKKDPSITAAEFEDNFNRTKGNEIFKATGDKIDKLLSGKVEPTTGQEKTIGGVTYVNDGKGWKIKK